MRRTRIVAILIGALLALGPMACRKAGSHDGHAAAHGTPEPPPPTPDFTPITLLRTPAGLVLQTEAEAQPTAPAASSTPPPAPTPAATP